MKQISKTEAREKIETFFSKSTILPEEARKIKRLAMRFNLKLGKRRARFCQECFTSLATASTRVTKQTILKKCPRCGKRAKITIS